MIILLCTFCACPSAVPLVQCADTRNTLSAGNVIIQGWQFASISWSSFGFGMYVFLFAISAGGLWPVGLAKAALHAAWMAKTEVHAKTANRASNDICQKQLPLFYLLKWVFFCLERFFWCIHWASQITRKTPTCLQQMKCPPLQLFRNPLAQQMWKIWRLWQVIQFLGYAWKLSWGGHRST